METWFEILLFYFVQLSEIISLIGVGYASFAFLGLKMSAFKLPVLPLALSALGIIPITLLVSLLNFFFPVSYIVSCFIWLLGIILLEINKKKITKLFRICIKPIMALTAFVFALGLIWGIQIGDTFGYHIHATKWIAESKMPLGQANLDCRLGYNSLIFNSYAATEFLMFKLNKPFFSFFPVFISLFLFASVTTLIRILRKRKRADFSDCYLSAFIVIAVIYNRSFGSLATDLSSVIFAWLSFYLAALYGENKNKDIFTLFVIVSFFTATIKLSMAPICLLIVFSVYECLKCNRILNVNFKYLLKPIGIIALLGVVFIVKGYFQSGYPAFPSSFLPIDVEWKVPKNVVDNERDFIKFFARDYSRWQDKQYINSIKWVPRWIVQFLIYERASWLSFLFLSGLFIAFKRYFLLSKSQKTILLVSIFGCLFVFYNAPSARFAHVFTFTALFVPLLSFIANTVNLSVTFNRKSKLPIFLLLIAAFFLLLSALFIYDNYFGSRIVNANVLKMFPSTQMKSLPFVYASFALVLCVAGFLLFFVWNKLNKFFMSGSSDLKLSIETSKVLVAVLLIVSLSHLILELPAILGNHVRLRFPDVKRRVNSERGLTTYYFEPWVCNNELLATTNPHEVIAEKINGRYRFRQ